MEPVRLNPTTIEHNGLAMFRPIGHPLSFVTKCPHCWKDGFVSLPSYPGDYFDCEACNHSWAPTKQQKWLMRPNT